MPDKKTLERARQDEREGKAPSTQAGEFVREEMDHIRDGKHGARSSKQAIAIGLSKARRAGVKLAPPKPGTTSRKIPAGNTRFGEIRRRDTEEVCQAVCGKQSGIAARRPFRSVQRGVVKTSQERRCPELVRCCAADPCHDGPAPTPSLYRPVHVPTWPGRPGVSDETYAPTTSGCR